MKFLTISCELLLITIACAQYQCNPCPQNEPPRVLDCYPCESNNNYLKPANFDVSSQNPNAHNQENPATFDQNTSKNSEPGYLPDYRGDKFTDPQRIKDTQALNAPFFESIGGEPTYPGGVPPKNGSSTNDLIAQNYNGRKK